MAACLVSTAAVAQVTSGLWGGDGEQWDRNGPLRDFTRVGYLEGAVQIPDWPVGVNVRDFGAKGDGRHDDTQAFRDAIAACPEQHAILIPKGRYRITEQIVLGPEDKSHFVFRGEDMFESVIHFPYYTREIHGSPHSLRDPLAGGFFQFSGGTHRSFENLSFVFRDQPKGGHWETIGADAVDLLGTDHSWLRNLHVRNADHAFRISGTHVTMVNVIFDAYIDRGNKSHTPVKFSGRFCLFHHIRILGSWEHDLMTVNTPDDNVWSKWRGPDIRIEHHSQGGDRNLFTDIDLGVGTGNHRKAMFGDDETYWNIRADLNLPLRNPRKSRNVFVGITTDEAAMRGEDHWHEKIDPEMLEPANLYLAQMTLAGKPLPREIPLEIPAPGGEVIVLPAIAEAPLKMGAEADTNLQGTPLVARVTYQDNNTELFLLKFVIPAMERTDIPRATLQLRGVEDAANLRITWLEDDAWDPATVTYRTAPKDGVEQVSHPASSTTSWVDVDVTGPVRQQLEGDRTLSFLVQARSKGGPAARFASGRLILEQEDTPAYPAAPSGLRVTAIADGILVEWEDGTEADLASYTLHRTPENDPDRLGTIRAAGLDEPRFEDRFVEAGQTYTYWVQAMDTGTRLSIESPRADIRLPDDWVAEGRPLPWEQRDR